MKNSILRLPYVSLIFHAMACHGLQLWFSDCFRYLLKFLYTDDRSCIFVLLLERSRTLVRQMDDYKHLYDFLYNDMQCGYQLNNKALSCFWFGILKEPMAISRICIYYHG